MRRFWISGALIAASACPGVARATTATAPAGNGQAALTVEASSAGVRANGVAIEVPESAKRLLANAKVDVLELENGRRVVHVTAADASSSWEALVAGPLAGQTAPAILFSGVTGGARGDSGEDTTGAIGIEPAARGMRVVVGERHQDKMICGRSALLVGHALDPATLTMTKFASFQSLGEKERAGAKAIAATPLAAPTLLPIRLLRTKVASSAVERSLGALTDANLDTAWSEATVGEGRGEFVAFDAAAEVPITAIELAVRPGVDVPHGVAPRTVFIATDDKLFKVTLPEDGFRRARSAFNIAFSEPLQTSCLAVVLDESYGGKGDRDARTTLTEVTARTAYDGMNVEALVGALAGGGARARGAGAVLERGGKPAADAAAAAYPKLDDLGKELARRVVDAGAPCTVRAPFYEKRFEETVTRGKAKGASPGDVDPDYSHAVHVLTTACKNDGAAAFARLLGSSTPKVRLAAAEQLSLLAPSQAVGALLDALATADATTRSDLIRALGSAARSTRARLAVARELEAAKFAARAEPVRIALLRAVGPELAHVDGGPQAFAGLAVPNAPFSTRYLLQAPAAELARGGDAKGAAYLEASLSRDADAHVRARAAEMSAKVPAVEAALAKAVDDPEVRVREAAIIALADARGGAFVEPIARRLASDDWTFVRAAAARTLGAQPAGAQVDAALAAALEDATADVRGRAATALGEHHATAHTAAVRKLANKNGEALEVRAQAVSALGALCDTASLDMLTKIAQRGAQPFDDVGRTIGPAAIEALGAIHPADLEARLAPLLAKNVTGPVREMANAAKRGKGSCGK